MSAAFRTEQLCVTRRVKRGLITLALLRGAKAEHDLAQAPQTADAIADEVLGKFLDEQPDLTLRETKIRRAIKAIEEEQP